MAGQANGKPSGRKYPERVTVPLLGGWIDRIDTAAADAEMTRAEWMRRLIRRGLEAARKARARQGS